MSFIVMGTRRDDGLISADFFGNLNFEEMQKLVGTENSVIMKEHYVFPKSPAPNIFYDVLVDPVKKEYVYEPYEMPQEEPQEETVAKLREELVAANERLEALTEQVAAIAKARGNT